MDPYLENPGLWPEVHHNLTSEIQSLLTTQLRPRYLVRIEERVYITDETDETYRSELRIPDVEVLSRPGWEETRSEGEAASSQLEVANIAPGSREVPQGLTEQRSQIMQPC
jgi:hypothetical protein